MMRLRFAFAGLMVLALPAFAAAPVLDEAVMENIEIVNESLGSNLGLQDASASTTDAQDLESLFAEVEKYFVARSDAADGVEYARQSRATLARVVKAIEAKDFQGASGLATEVSRTCKSCHRKYKPD